MNEAKFINSSLMALRNAIQNLVTGKKVNWRESKLTQVLKQQLSGENCLTSLCVCASKRESNRYQTMGTLKFADQAKKIEVSAVQNTHQTRAEIERLIQDLQKKVFELQKKLDSKQKAEAEASNNEAIKEYLNRIKELEEEIKRLEKLNEGLDVSNKEKDEIIKSLKQQNNSKDNRIQELEMTVEQSILLEQEKEQLEAEFENVNLEKINLE
eukprot:UN33087